MTQHSGDAQARHASSAYRVWSFVSEYSLLLLLGAFAALLWANIDYHSYHAVIEYPLWVDAPFGVLHDGHRTLTVHYLVNDALMALFFAIAGKEVWEAVALREGSLRGKKAVTPLIATAGGVVGPVAVYLLVAALLGAFDQLFDGWAIPTATDIAFSYLVGRLIFGAGHPAVGFLLLLAIADDAVGLIIIAVFYTDPAALAPEWLLVSAAAAALVYGVFNYLPRRAGAKHGAAGSGRLPGVVKKLGVWPYIVGGLISWYAFTRSGVHPALGLLPIIPAIPHADIAHRFFDDAERHMGDLLNRMEHALKLPVEVVLLLFGLANAGVALLPVDPETGVAEFAFNGATWAVLAGLFIGKPLGVWLFGEAAARGLSLGFPEGMRSGDLFVVGCIAAIGFTVALFVAGEAFPAGALLDGAKIGALLSFFAAAMAIIAARLIQVRKMRGA